MLYCGHGLPMMKSQMVRCLSHLVVLMLLIRFVDDSFDEAYSYVAYMVIFISSRRRTKFEYTSSLFDDVKYPAIIMPSKMHKFHMVDEDSYSSWISHGILVEDS